MKGKEKLQREGPNSSAGKTAPAEPQLSTGRKVLFGFIGFVILPLLALLLVEVILRLGGVGYNPAFFKSLRIGGEKYIVENDRFGLRFFPPELARSPAPSVFKAKKEPGVTRIFILGESAALGDPRPSYGAGRYLQALLRQRYPNGRFEVIAAAVTAINSHALVPIARECARYEGDLWIIYMGNNEMVGPFGATTVLGSHTPPLSYLKFSLAVQRTRIGQLVMAAGRRLSEGKSREPGWTGMRMWMENRIPPKDSRKEVVYRNFAANYKSILNAGADAGVKVIYGTVCVNLRDCAPFASIQRSLPESQKQQFKELLSKTPDLDKSSDDQGATGAYEQLAATDPENAEVQFRLGKLYFHNGETEQAKLQFQRARDCDALPFRTDSRLNGIVREIRKQRQPSTREVFVDSEEWLATNAIGGIPGRDLFHEHVHFNFNGNYALARLWADQVAVFLPANSKSGDRGHWAAQSDCELKLGLTDWNRHEVLVEVQSRLGQPPFTGQLDHAAEMERLRAQLRLMRSQVTNQQASAAREVYVSAINSSPKDHRLHENFGEFLELTGALAEATEQWETVRGLIPHHHSGYFNTGRLLMRQGKLRESEERLLQTLELRPDLAEGWLVLGQVQALKRDPKAALQNYREAQKLTPNDPRVYYHMGQALSKLQQGAAAIESYNLAVRLKPTFWEARYALGEELAFSGKPAEARAQFEQVLQVNPIYPMAHLNLGVALIELKQYELALHHLEQAQRLDPSNPRAGEYAKKIRAVLGKQ